MCFEFIVLAHKTPRRVEPSYLSFTFWGRKQGIAEYGRMVINFPFTVCQAEALNNYSL